MSGSGKAMLVCGAVVLAVAPTVAWSMLFGEPSVASDHDRATNGVRIGPDWLAGDGSADAARLALSMHALGLRTVYADLGVADPAGGLARRAADGGRTAVDEQVAIDFLQRMRAVAPEVKVLPSLGGRLAKDVRPADVDQRAGIAATAGALVAGGAPGVHLAVAGASSATPGFLGLVEEVKSQVADATLSVRGTLPTRDGETIAGLAALCTAADELVIPIHGTGAWARLAYETRVAWTTRQLVRALPAPEQGGCTWSLEIPTVDQPAPRHDPGVETLATALAGVRRGLGSAPVPTGLGGVVIQDARTMSVREWGTYEAAWRGRSGSGVSVPGGPDGV